MTKIKSRTTEVVSDSDLLYLINSEFK